MTVSGVAGKGYEEVRAVFEELFKSEAETGAALSVWKDGEEVVGLAGGAADAGMTKAWTPDTLVHTYSTSKPFASLAALTAVAGGAIGLDEPVADHWKEYAANGKQDTTLRHVLTHRAGLPAFPPAAADLDLLDDEGLRRSLAEATPLYEPGTTTAEHAVTYGHLIDGVLRAATGRSLGEIYAADVRPVLGMDGWFGVPDTEMARVADLEYQLPGGPAQFVAEVCPSYEDMLQRPAGLLDLERLNTDEWRQSVFGAINLHTSASALGGFYARLTSPDGPVRRLLGEQLHAEFLASQACGFDQTVGISVNWTLGPLRTPHFVGLGGLGGSAAWWSFRHDHAVGFVTKRLHDHARVAQIAAALGDDINMQVDCD
ncbi:MAG TPA: serine hydrolase domain-containing protein [Nocardioides sp.]|nr:serine hydrolase domain-containing protein [Nocardioides sp.]